MCAWYILQLQKRHSFIVDESLKIRLHAALSDAYIDLNRNAEKAKDLLESLEIQLKVEGKTVDNLTPHDRARINIAFGKAYR